MYYYISGQLVEATPSFAVIDCGGVGYQLEVTLNTYSQIKDQQTVRLLVHEIIREDAHLLFGFYQAEERDMFRLLLGVNGVGAASARVLLSSLTVEELQEAILSQNVKRIQSAKGIGAKTAQRIALELHDKVGGLAGGRTPDFGMGQQGNVEEAAQALVMLGFAKNAVDKVLAAVAKENASATVEELIKQALQKL